MSKIIIENLLKKNIDRQKMISNGFMAQKYDDVSRGKSSYKLNEIIEISKKFNLSLDYLVYGEENNLTSNPIEVKFSDNILSEKNINKIGMHCKDNLAFLQDELSNEEMAKIGGVSLATYKNYLSGAIPSLSALINYSKHFKVSINHILGIHYSDEELSIGELELLNTYREIDKFSQHIVKLVAFEEKARVISSNEYISKNTVELSLYDLPVSAGLGDYLEDYEQWKKVSVPLTLESRKADFILKVDGDSMEPEFNDGDYLLIRQQPAIEEGQIGIFVYDGNGYVKKFGGDRLISLNRRYKDIIIKSGNCLCYGLVLGTTEILEK